MYKGVSQGRGGLGMVYVFAAGNSYAMGEDINALPIQSSRFTICVGAVSAGEEARVAVSAGARVRVSERVSAGARARVSERLRRGWG